MPRLVRNGALGGASSTRCFRNSIATVPAYWTARPDAQSRARRAMATLELMTLKDTEESIP